jgi:hypothetical protein
LNTALFVALQGECILLLLEQADGWSQGINSSGRVGFFPQSYVRPLGPGEHVTITLVCADFIFDQGQLHPAFETFDLNQPISHAVYKSTPPLATLALLWEATYRQMLRRY